MSLGAQLNAHFALGINLGYTRYGADFAGPAEQADYSRLTPVYYTAASTYDESAEALFFAAYQL